MVLIKGAIELLLSLLDPFVSLIMIGQELKMMHHGGNGGSAYDFGPDGSVVPIILNDKQIMLRVITEIHRIPVFGKMFPKPFKAYFFQLSFQILDPIPFNGSSFAGEMIPP